MGISLKITCKYTNFKPTDLKNTVWSMIFYQQFIDQKV